MSEYPRVQLKIILSAEAVKYTNCNTAEVRLLPPNKCPWHDIKLHLMVSLGDLENEEHLFVAITPKSTLIWSGSTC